jgi:hypothetical protein
VSLLILSEIDIVARDNVYTQGAQTATMAHLLISAMIWGTVLVGRSQNTICSRSFLKKRMSQSEIFIYFLFLILSGRARAVNLSTEDGLPAECQPAPATPPRVSRVVIQVV